MEQTEDGLGEDEVDECKDLLLPGDEMMGDNDVTDTHSNCGDSKQTKESKDVDPFGGVVLSGKGLMDEGQSRFANVVIFEGAQPVSRSSLFLR
jgi:hypothetical protein